MQKTLQIGCILVMGKAGGQPPKTNSEDRLWKEIASGNFLHFAKWYDGKFSLTIDNLPFFSKLKPI